MKSDDMADLLDLLELKQRIVLARTPTIASEDALTVAKLHDLVIAWTVALENYEALRPWDGPSIHATAKARLDEATAALRLIAKN